MKKYQKDYMKRYKQLLPTGYLIAMFHDEIVTTPKMGELNSRKPYYILRDAIYNVYKLSDDWKKIRTGQDENYNSTNA